MNKNEWWNYVCEKNPTFATDGVHFTAKGLIKFLDQTWDMAIKSVEKKEKEPEEIMPDFFEQLLKRTKK